MFELWFALSDYPAEPPFVVHVDAMGDIERARETWDRLAREFYMISSRP